MQSPDKKPSDIPIEELVVALESMAKGEGFPSEHESLERKPKKSPLAHTQGVRIMGRTIRSGLE